MIQVGRGTILTIIVVAATVAFWQLVPQVLAGQTDQVSRVLRRGSPALDAALVDDSSESKSRLREGMLFHEKRGTFSAVGDSVTFHPEGVEEPLGVLQNLALERIWSMLGDAEDRYWSVSGMVTEYRGRNFLFVHRAVLRTKTARPDNQRTVQP